MSVRFEPSSPRSASGYGLESKTSDSATVTHGDRPHRRSVSWPAVDQLTRAQVFESEEPDLLELTEEIEVPRQSSFNISEVSCFSWLLCLIPNCIASFFIWIKDLIVGCFEEYIPGSEEDRIQAQKILEQHAQPKVRSASEQFHRSIFLMGKEWKMTMEKEEEERTKTSFNCQSLLLGIVTLANGTEFPFKSPKLHYFSQNRKKLPSELAEYVSSLNLEDRIQNFQIALISVKSDPLKRNTTTEEATFFYAIKEAAEPSMLPPARLDLPLLSSENKSRFTQQTKDLSSLFEHYPFLKNAGLEASDLLLPSAFNQLQAKAKIASRPVTKNNLQQLRVGTSALLQRYKGSDSFQSSTVMISLTFKNGKGETSSSLFTKERGTKQFSEPETMHFADFTSTMEEVIERVELARKEEVQSFVLEYVEIQQADEAISGRAVGFYYNPPNRNTEPPKFAENPKFKELPFTSLAEYEEGGFSIPLASRLPVEPENNPSPTFHEEC